jgi:hypothetical protein
MKESYTEGLANHGGRESCVGIRKVVGEALTAVCTGWVLSPENRFNWVPTPLSGVEGNTRCVVNCEIHRDPAWSKTPYMCRNSLRGNRDIPCLTMERTTMVRVENPKGVSRR